MIPTSDEFFDPMGDERFFSVWLIALSTGPSLAPTCTGRAPEWEDPLRAVNERAFLFAPGHADLVFLYALLAW